VSAILLPSTVAITEIDDGRWRVVSPHGVAYLRHDDPDRWAKLLRIIATHIDPSRVDPAVPEVPHLT
jgi:hypothetical protein